MLPLLLFCSIGSTSAFLFPMMGGGGGSGCCPPPRPCCPQPCPPPPPPPPPCPLPPPCPPAPSCGGCCGGGGSFGGGSSNCGGCGGCRRKREALVVSKEEDLLKCNSRELKNLLEKNIEKSVADSMDSLEKASRNYSDYVILCNKKPISFLVNAARYCQVEKNAVNCLMIQLDSLSLHLM